MTARIRDLVCVVAVLVTAMSILSTALALTTPQLSFVEGKRALAERQFNRFQQHLKRLEGHALYPFLEYEFLKSTLDKIADVVVEGFLRRHPDTVVSRWLREAWLLQLAKRDQWDRFLTAYQYTGNDELQCHRLQALITTDGISDALDRQIERAWSRGSSQPDACDPVFSAWHAAGRLSSERVWARIRLAFERGQVGLAQYLARTYLEASEQSDAARWVAIYRSPITHLVSAEFPLDIWIAQRALGRLAEQDATQAALLWQELGTRYEFDVDEHDQAYRRIGLSAAFQHHPLAVQWLSRVSQDADDPTLRHWRVRAALRSMNWQAVLDFLEHLSPLEQNDSRWRYWRARALEQTDNRERAMSVYRSVAGSRNYYSFLAADRIDAPYSMDHRPASVDQVGIDAVAAQPGLNMAFELRAVGEGRLARQQWDWSVRNFDSNTIRAAGILAHRRGWHDRAIVGAHRGDYFDDLKLRFPLLHHALIEANAHRYGIDPGWVLGVIRQESAFIEDARSPVGAVGLMQLMPETGRRVARRLNIKIEGSHSLYNVDNNIRLGTAYLSRILDRNAGNPVLATAAYNAGPHRVDRWLPNSEALSADIWVETIPFKETRNFVENVLAFTVVYDHRLGKTPLPLKQRMPKVAPRRQRVQG